MQPERVFHMIREEMRISATNTHHKFNLQEANETLGITDSSGIKIGVTSVYKVYKSTHLFCRYGRQGQEKMELHSSLCVPT
ncbi:hypothetical protein EJB05_38033, partial [Eragrostis curvula]